MENTPPMETRIDGCSAALKRLICLAAALFSMFSPCAAMAGPSGPDEVLSRMTLDDKIGQTIMPGYQGAALSPEMERILETYRLGGFVLFGGRNVINRSQSAKLTESLQKKAMSVGAGVPLFLSIDQECGVGSHVNNVTGGVDTVGNYALAVDGDPVDAYATYRIMADDLNAFGLNMALAPVLDLMWNKAHPMKNVRTFGPDPEKAAELARAAVRGFQDGGIIASAKHFPGSGETALDSHEGTPRNRAPKESLLKPFRGAIEGGVDVLMLGSERYVDIDPDNVNNVSKTIITDIARKELGFDGMILTGSITMSRGDMKADAGELAVRALLAGADMILFANGDEKDFSQAIEAIRSALKGGRLSMERLDDAATRILRLKIERGLWDRVPTPAGVYRETAARNEAVVMRIARRTINVLKNDGGLLPLDRRKGSEILTVSPRQWFTVPPMNVQYPLGTSLAAAVRRMAPEARSADYETGSLRSDLALAVEKARDPGVKIIVFGSIHGYYSDEFVQFARALKETGKKLAVVGMTSPWDLDRMPFADAFVAANNPREPSIRAAVETMFGKIRPSNNIPVPAGEAATEGKEAKEK